MANKLQLTKLQKLFIERTKRDGLHDHTPKQVEKACNFYKDKNERQTILDVFLGDLRRNTEAKILDITGLWYTLRKRIDFDVYFTYDLSSHTIMWISENDNNSVDSARLFYTYKKQKKAMVRPAFDLFIKELIAKCQ